MTSNDGNGGDAAAPQITFNEAILHVEQMTGVIELTQEMVDESDKVITMGCAIDESCPAVFVPSEDWGLEDPSGQPVEVVRRIRNQVEERVRSMIPALFQ